MRFITRRARESASCPSRRTSFFRLLGGRDPCPAAGSRTGFFQRPKWPGKVPRAGSGTRRPRGIMIRKLKSGEYRLYSRKVDPKTGRRRNLGTFKTRTDAEQHEREVQFF